MPKESEIYYDRQAGMIVWKMTPDVADFYSFHIRPGDDMGVAEDIGGLRSAVEDSKVWD